MKLCLRCNQYFEDTEALCPKDKAPLESVGKDPLIGALISDRYVVESVIGKGSSGIVYKARRMQRGEMVVAVKVLHSFLGAESGSLDRFLREARAASRLRNPHIITIWDSGVTDDGQPYFVMDYLEGITLAHLIREREFLHATRAFQIIRQICEALTEAHKQGIIHRDLKPENVVLQETDYGDDYVKLLDFGIAESPYDSLKQKLEKVKTVAGSPAYMSPEQCQGLDLDARSDIYSLAILTFEMLTGERPLQSDEHMSLMYMHVTSPPLRLADVRPEMNFPPKLEEALARALSKKPAQRQASVKEYWSDLEASVKGTEFAELGPKPKKAAPETTGGFSIPEADRLMVEDDPKFGVKQTGWGFQDVNAGTVIKKSTPAPLALDTERVGFETPKPMDFRPGAAKGDALFIPPSTNTPAGTPTANSNETPPVVDPALDWSLPQTLKPSLDWTKPDPTPQAEAPNPVPQVRTPSITPMWAQSLEVPAINLDAESLRSDAPAASPEAVSEPVSELVAERAEPLNNPVAEEAEGLDLDLDLDAGLDRIRTSAQSEVASQDEPPAASLQPVWSSAASSYENDPAASSAPAPTQSIDPEPVPAPFVLPTPWPTQAIDPDPVPAPAAPPAPWPTQSIDPESVPAPVAPPAPWPTQSIEPEPVPAPVVPPATALSQTEPVPAPVAPSFFAPTQSIEPEPVPTPVLPPASYPSQSLETEPVPELVAPSFFAPTQSIEPEPVPTPVLPPAPYPSQSVEREPVPELVAPSFFAPAQFADPEPVPAPAEPLAPLPVAASIAEPFPLTHEIDPEPFELPVPSPLHVAALASTSVSDNGITGSETPAVPSLGEASLQTAGLDTKSGTGIEAFKNWALRQVGQAPQVEQTKPVAQAPVAQVAQAPLAEAPHSSQTQVGGVTKNGDRQASSPIPVPLVKQKSKPSLIALGGGQKPVPNLAANLLAKIAAERGEPLPSKEESSEPVTDKVADQSSDQLQSVAQAQEIAQPPVWDADFSAHAQATSPVEPPPAHAFEPAPLESKLPEEQIPIVETSLKSNDAMFEAAMATYGVPEVEAVASAPFINEQPKPAEPVTHTPSEVVENKTNQSAFETPKVEELSEPPAFEIEMDSEPAPEPLIKEASPQVPVTATWQSILQDIAPAAPVKAREADNKISGAAPPLQVLAGKDSARPKTPQDDAPPLDLLARLPRQTSPAQPVDQIRREAALPVQEPSIEPSVSPGQIAAGPAVVREFASETISPQAAASSPPQVLGSLSDAIGHAFDNAFLPEATAAPTPAPVKKEPPPQPELKPSVPVDYKSAIQAERKALLKTRQDAMAPQRALQEEAAASTGGEAQSALVAAASLDSPPLGQLSARAEAAVASVEQPVKPAPSQGPPQESDRPAPPLAALASIAQTSVPPQETSPVELLGEELEEDFDDDDGPNFTQSVVPGGLVRHPTGIIPVYNEKAAQEAIAASKFPPKETPIPNTVKIPLNSPATTKVMSALEKDEVKNKAAAPADETPAPPPAPVPQVKPAAPPLPVPVKPVAPPPLPAKPAAPAAKVENNQPAPSGLFMDISSIGQKSDEVAQPVAKAEPTPAPPPPQPANVVAPSPVSPAKPVIPEQKLSQLAAPAPQPAANQAVVPAQPKPAQVPAPPPVQPAPPKAQPQQPAPAPAPKPQPYAADKPPQAPAAPPPAQALKQALQSKSMNQAPAAQAANVMASEQGIDTDVFARQLLASSEGDRSDEIAARTSEPGKASSPLDRLIEVAKKGKKPGSGGTRASHDRIITPEEAARSQAPAPPQPSNIASASIASSTVNNSVKAVPSGQTSSGGPQSVGRISAGDYADKTFENTALARAADPRLAAQAKVSFPNQASLQAKRNQAVPAQMPLQPLNQQGSPAQQISRQQIPQVSLDHFPIDPALLQKMAQDEAQQVSDLVEAKRVAQKHRLVDSNKEEEEGFKAFVSQRYQAILERVHGTKKPVEKPRVSRAMATTRTRTTALRSRGPSLNITVVVLTMCVTLVGVACYSTIMNVISNKKPSTTSSQPSQGKKDYEEIRRTLEKRQEEGTLTKREQDDLCAAYVQLGQKEIKDKHYVDAVALLKKVSPKSASYPEATRLMKKLRRQRR